MLLNEPSKRLDGERLKSQKSVIDSKISLNLQRIEQKRRESSNVVKLESLRENLDLIKNLLDAANVAIQDHKQLG